ncbi:MAG: serine hydrolase [Candidatus Azambacteria bacterium]|nr:serine hydrolase [Candidatus Azambacteria bacterium]
MREKIDVTNPHTINRVRIVVVLMTALVFGVVLRDQMFSQEILAVNSTAQQSALVYRSVVTTSIEKNVAAPAEDVQQEGDAAPALEEPAAQEVALVDMSAPILIKENGAEPIGLSTVSLGVGTLSAKAFIIANGASGRDVSYEKNARERLPPASLTKLMTAVIVAEYADYSDVVTITPRAVNAEGVSGFLRVGETFSIPDLLKIMLVVSSNDAATAFEDYFTSKGFDFIALMNEKTVLLGMVDTHFMNPTGLDDPEHYSSAADLAVLVAYSLRHEQVWDILSRRSERVWSLNTKTEHALLSNNELLHKKRTDVLGGKTGYTKSAGGCMITVLKSGEILVVLGSDDRAGETIELINTI